MKRYIYYPNFEPPRDEWLKFALLYLDRVDSIVPYERRYLVSDNFRRLENETDLVEMFSPSYEQGERASLKALEETERILRRPYGYSNLFGKINVLRGWRDPSTWDYLIYGEKFTNTWSNFCEEERIGKRNHEGLLLPRSLAFLYMTCLANEIAFDRAGNIITDNQDYDRYTTYARGRTILTNQRDRFIRGVIKLKVPQDLNRIDFNTLISFRNNNIELINAFNAQIDAAENLISNGLSEQQFINNYNYTANALFTEVINLGLQIASVPLTFYVLAQNVNALSQEYIAEAVTALGVASTGFCAVRKSLYDSREQRLCRKYLVRLSSIR